MKPGHPDVMLASRGLLGLVEDDGLTCKMSWLNRALVEGVFPEFSSLLPP